MALECERDARVRGVEQPLEHVAAELRLPLGLVLDDVREALLQSQGVRVRVGVRARARARVGVGVRARVRVSNLVHVEEECDRHGRGEGHLVRFVEVC